MLLLILTFIGFILLLIGAGTMIASRGSDSGFICLMLGALFTVVFLFSSIEQAFQENKVLRQYELMQEYIDNYNPCSEEEQMFVCQQITAYNTVLTEIKAEVFVKSYMFFKPEELLSLELLEVHNK